VIRNLEIVPNKKIVDVNCTVYNNEGIRTYSTDVTIKTNAVITKMWVYGLIRSQRDDHDVKFTNEFFRCVVDVEKTLKSLQNNPLVAMIVDTFMSASEQKIKFPLEKVSWGRGLGWWLGTWLIRELATARWSSVQTLTHANFTPRKFQGIYKFTNITPYDDFILLPKRFKVYGEMKFVVRLRGAKKNVNYVFVSSVIEYWPNGRKMAVNGTGNYFHDMVMNSAKIWLGNEAGRWEGRIEEEEKKASEKGGRGGVEL
jgi:hypothetical protein